MKKHLIRSVGWKVAWAAVICLMATTSTMVAGTSANTAPCNVALINTDNNASASIGMGVQAVTSAGRKAFTIEVATEVRDTGQNSTQIAGNSFAVTMQNNAVDVGIAPNGGTLAAEIVACADATVSFNLKTS